MASKSDRVRHAVVRSTGATTWVRAGAEGWDVTCLNHGSSTTVEGGRGEAWKTGARPESFCGKCKSIAAGKSDRITDGRLDIPTPRSNKGTAKKATTKPAAKKAPAKRSTTKKAS